MNEIVKQDENWFDVLSDFWDFITEEGGAPGESELYLDPMIEKKYSSMNELLEEFAKTKADRQSRVRVPSSTSGTTRTNTEQTTR